jgi:CRP-like cAMP-binding protein
MSDARMVEVGLAGCEEIIGLPLVGALDKLPYSVVVQVPGDGFLIQAPIIMDALPSMPELSRVMVRRLSVRAAEQSQNTACNRLHSLDQRLARWLLLVRDRLDSDVIVTTHDFVASMVGADRTTVSLALNEFEAHGILEQARGSITIRDRRKLEKRSCECYSVLKRFNEELGLRT